MPSPAESPQGTNLLPVLAGLGLAVVGFFVAVNVTNALGYGKDTHTLRVAALMLPLLVGGVVAAWPSRSPTVRLAALMISVGCAVAAWVFTPASPGGISLAQVAAKQSEVKSLVAAAPTYRDVSKAGEIGAAFAATVTFPSLSTTLQSAVNAWGNAAVERITERFQTVNPGDVAGLDDVTTKANLLTKHLPQTRETVATVERAFSNRGADYWVSELHKVPLGNFVAFRTWGSKRDAVKSILPNPARIVEAEREWVANSVEASINRSELIQQFMPQRARDALLTLALDIRSLPSSGSETLPFRATRERLFAVALERAKEESRVHVSQDAFDLAVERAKTHETNWHSEALALGPDALAALSRYRSGYVYLATLAEKAGVGSDFVPPPRTKP